MHNGWIQSCSDPLAVLLLQVEIVRRVNAFLHASPVPRDPALDRHISGRRTQSELLKILYSHWRCWLKSQRVRMIMSSVTGHNVFALCSRQLAMSHSFIRFTAWRWIFPVVRVEWSQTRRGFLFLLFLSTSFLPFFDVLFFFLVTYLAPGCGDDMHNIVLCYDLKAAADYKMHWASYKMHWARLLLTRVKLLSPLGRLRDRFVRLLFLFMVTVIIFALLWTFLLLHHWLCLLGWSLQ